VSDSKKVGVSLPPSVLAIIDAAGGREDFPRAMASIVGALPWIAVALHGALEQTEYRALMGQVRHELQGAWAIIAAPDPRIAFEAAVDAAKREIN